MIEVRSEAGLVAVERRFNPASAEFRPELRSVAGSNRPHIQGYGSVFGKLSRNLGGFVEQVDPQAFRNANSQNFPDVVCRYNHSDDWLLGTTKAGTCVLSVDGTGLHYDVEVPNTTRGNDVAELARRGDISSSSFAFRVPDGGDYWERSNQVGGLPLRTLTDLELVDVAPVNTPAYPDATASVRNYLGAVESLARQFGEDPAEIRSLMENNQIVKLFKRSDRPSATAHNTEVSEMANDEGRAKISTASKNDLPDSSFAYIEPGGEKDEQGKTKPRSKRHFPIHDAAHVRNALSRIGQGAQFGKEAMPKVKAAAKKFGVGAGGDDSRDFEDDELVLRAIAEDNDLRGLIFDADDEERAKKQLPPWLQKKQGDAQDSSDSSDDSDAPAQGSTDEDEDDEDNAQKTQKSGQPASKKATKQPPAKREDDSEDEQRDSSTNEDQEKSDNEDDDDELESQSGDSDDQPSSNQRSAPGQPESKDDEKDDEAEKAQAEKEMKQKAADLENKRKYLQLMEKRYDPYYFDGE